MIFSFAAHQQIIQLHNFALISSAYHDPGFSRSVSGLVFFPFNSSSQSFLISSLIPLHTSVVQLNSWFSPFWKGSYILSVLAAL